MQQPTESAPSPDSSPFQAFATSNYLALKWLARAWDDLRACPIPSLFYGFCYAGMGLLITFVFEHACQYTAGLTSGFLLLGPLLAMGLYEISRRRELGQACALRPTLTVWRRNISNLAIYTVVVGVIFLVWARASLVVSPLLYQRTQSLRLSGQILALENLEFLLVYFCVGCCLRPSSSRSAWWRSR